MAEATRNDPAPLPVPEYTVTLELDKEEAGYLRTLLYSHVAGDLTSRNGALSRIHRALVRADVAIAIPVVDTPDHRPPYAVLNAPTGGPNYRPSRTYYGE